MVGWGGLDGNGNGNGEVILKCIRASLQNWAEEFWDNINSTDDFSLLLSIVLWL